MDTIEAIHGRRSIRSYTATPLEHDQVESVLWDAAQAPPPFSGDPYAFNVIQGVERDRRKFGGESAGWVFWRLFSDLRWTGDLDCEVGETRG